MKQASWFPYWGWSWSTAGTDRQRSNCYSIRWRDGQSRKRVWSPSSAVAWAQDNAATKYAALLWTTSCPDTSSLSASSSTSSSTTVQWPWIQKWPARWSRTYWSLLCGSWTNTWWSLWTRRTWWHSSSWRTCWHSSSWRTTHASSSWWWQRYSSRTPWWRRRNLDGK